MLEYTGTLPARSTAAVGESAYIVWATSGRPLSSAARADLAGDVRLLPGELVGVLAVAAEVPRQEHRVDLARLEHRAGDAGVREEVLLAAPGEVDRVPGRGGVRERRRQIGRRARSTGAAARAPPSPRRRTRWLRDRRRRRPPPPAARAAAGREGAPARGRSSRRASTRGARRPTGTPPRRPRRRSPGRRCARPRARMLASLRPTVSRMTGVAAAAAASTNARPSLKSSA